MTVPAPDQPSAVAGPPEPVAPRRGLLSRVGWSAVAQVAPMIAVLLLTPFLISQLGVDRYGAWALLTALLAAGVTLDGGLAGALLRWFGLTRASGDVRTATRLVTTTLLLVLVVGGLLTALVGYAAPALATLPNAPDALRGELELLLRWLMPLVVLHVVGLLFGAQLEAQGRFRALAVRALTVQVSYAVAVVLVVPDHGLRGLLAATVGRNALNALLAVVAAAQHFSWRHVGLARAADLRPFAAFGARLQGTALAIIVLIQADALIVALLLPVRFVGYYGVAAQLAMALRALPVFAQPPLSSHLLQTFGRGGHDAPLAEGGRLQRDYVRLTSGYFLIATATAFPAMLAWLGPDYRTSAVLAAMLLVGHTFALSTGVMTTLTRAVGRPGLETQYGVVTAVLKLALTGPLLLAGIYGVVGATVLAQAVGALWFLRLVRRKLDPDFPSFLREVPVLPGAVAAVLSGAASLALAGVVQRGLVGLLAAGVPAGVALLGYVWWLRRTGRLGDRITAVAPGTAR